MDDPNLIDELQQEVDTRDAIIQALTSQLETTAEQLERLQRTGSAGGSKDSGFGAAVNARVRQYLEEFDDSTPLEHFERIEIGIEQILEILAGSTTSIAELRKLPKAELDLELDEEIDDLPEEVADTSEEDDSEVDVQSKAEEDFWAATKARLFQQAEQDPSSINLGATFSGEKKPASHTSAHEPVVEETASPVLHAYTPIPIPPEPEPLPDLPKPLKSFQDVRLLEEAVTERDRFIGYLVTRLRRAESYPFPPIDWERATAIPEDLKKAVASLEQHLKDHLRQSELSVSLERAALTRERSKLCQVKSQLQDEIQKMVAATNVPQKSTPEERMNRMFEIPKDTGPKYLE